MMRRWRRHLAFVHTALPSHPIMVPKPALASGTNHPGALFLFCFGPHRLRQHPSQAREPQRLPLSHAVAEMLGFILQLLRVDRLLNPTQILHDLLELESLQQCQIMRKRKFLRVSLLTSGEEEGCLLHLGVTCRVLHAIARFIVSCLALFIFDRKASSKS
jgi:hypothetical protein